MPVHTALGPIEPGDLGPTSMHEHVFFDASEVYTVGQLDTVDEPLTVAMLGDLHWNSVLNKQNLILEDPESIIDDLKLLRDHGGGAIVEATTLGLSRRIAELPAVSTLRLGVGSIGVLPTPIGLLLAQSLTSLSTCSTSLTPALMAQVSCPHL